MPLSAENSYRAHVKNLREVDAACSHVHRHLTACLALDQERIAKSLLKTQMLLVGAWAEVRLLKLLFETSGFDAAERKKILAIDAQLDKWKFAVELGFRRKFNIPKAPLTVGALGPANFGLYSEINNIVEEELRPIIEVRNRLAHGQWARAFNNELDEISAHFTGLIHAENALSLTFKKQMLEALSKLVHDLVASPTAFLRDANMHYRVLHQARMNLGARSYRLWVDGLKAKRTRGRKRARASVGSEER